MLEEEFLKFGFTKEEYNKIRNSHVLRTYYEETILKKLLSITDYLLSLRYSKKEIIKMISMCPEFISSSIDGIRAKISDMKDKGCSREEIKKMIKDAPQIIRLDLRKKIEDLKSIGYTEEEIIEMAKKFSTTLGLDAGNVLEKLTGLKELGYKEQSAKQMTCLVPELFSYSIESIKQRLDVVKGAGYSEEEALFMTETFPSIFGFCIESLSQRFLFYNSINLHNFILEKPKNLMQSVALSYARHEFYKSKDIVIDDSNATSKLFMNSRNFIKQYGISKEELLSMYDYNKAKEESIDGTTY